jgi:uncharacterized BrkB/YihY/UPF0761 family membrane protein
MKKPSKEDIIFVLIPLITAVLLTEIGSFYRETLTAQNLFLIETASTVLFVAVAIIAVYRYLKSRDNK